MRAPAVSAVPSIGARSNLKSGIVRGGRATGRAGSLHSLVNLGCAHRRGHPRRVAVHRLASSAAGLRHLRPETLDVAAEVGLRIIGGKE